MSSPLPSRLLPLPTKPPSPAIPATTILQFPLHRHYARSSRFKCSAGDTGFFTKLGRLIKEKAKSDVDKIFSGFTKTRDNLAVVDELLLYWNLSDTDRVLDELEEVRDLFLAKNGGFCSWLTCLKFWFCWYWLLLMNFKSSWRIQLLAISRYPKMLACSIVVKAFIQTQWCTFVVSWADATIIEVVMLRSWFVLF